MFPAGTAKAAFPFSEQESENAAFAVLYSILFFHDFHISR